MRKVLLVAAIALILGHIPDSSREVKAGPVVTTNGNVTFQSDGFESDSADQFPSVTSVGTWATNNEISDALVKVGGANGIPVAAEGSQLLAFPVPNNPDVSRSIAEAQLSAKALIGQTVNAQFSLFTSTTEGSRHFAVSFSAPGAFSGYSRGVNWVGVMNPVNAAAEGLSTVGLGPNDWVLANFTGAQWVNITKASDGMPLGFAPDSWHAIEMTAKVGSGVFTMSVDGTVSSPTSMRQNLEITSLLFQQNSYPTYPAFYVDGPRVPEPTTLVTLCIGLVAALVSTRLRSQ